MLHSTRVKAATYALQAVVTHHSQQLFKRSHGAVTAAAVAATPGIVADATETSIEMPATMEPSLKPVEQQAAVDGPPSAVENAAKQPISVVADVSSGAAAATTAHGTAMAAVAGVASASVATQAGVVGALQPQHQARSAGETTTATDLPEQGIARGQGEDDAEDEDDEDDEDFEACVPRGRVDHLPRRHAPIPALAAPFAMHGITCTPPPTPPPLPWQGDNARACSPCRRGALGRQPSVP